LNVGRTGRQRVTVQIGAFLLDTLVAERRQWERRQRENEKRDEPGARASRSHDRTLAEDGTAHCNMKNGKAKARNRVPFRTSVSRSPVPETLVPKLPLEGSGTLCPLGPEISITTLLLAGYLSILVRQQAAPYSCHCPPVGLP